MFLFFQFVDIFYKLTVSWHKNIVSFMFIKLDIFPLTFRICNTMGLLLSSQKQGRSLLTTWDDGKPSRLHKSDCQAFMSWALWVFCGLSGGNPLSPMFHWFEPTTPLGGLIANPCVLEKPPQPLMLHTQSALWWLPSIKWVIPALAAFYLQPPGCRICLPSNVG